MSNETISYMEIQGALERCMAVNPPSGPECGLSMDASLLGDIIGEMIYRNLDNISVSVVTGRHREALNQWLVTDRPVKQIESSVR